MDYVEAWKHKFRKSQKEAREEYVAQVGKIREFLEQLKSNKETTKSKHSSSKSPVPSYRDPVISLSTRNPKTVPP